MNNKKVSNYSVNHKKRILYLDGLRGLAILMVVLFHAYSRWSEIVPYSNQFSNFLLFEYGKFGVQLFFMISGFVILMTLENCNDFTSFMYRRWLRLFPAMLVCSMIIYLTSSFFVDGPKGHSVLKDTIPGLLFVEPELITLIFDSPQGVLEGSFWSLFVEMKFYIFAGLLYFFTTKKIMINTIIILFLISTAYIKLSQVMVMPQSFQIGMRLLSIEHFGWFAVGALFYEYHLKKNKASILIAVFIALVAARNANYGFLSEGMFIIVPIISIFVLALINTRLQSLLQNKVLIFLGFISYPFYLLHENMMVSMIVKLGKLLPNLPNILLPIMPILSVIIIAYFVAKYLEPACRDAIKLTLAKIKGYSSLTV